MNEPSCEAGVLELLEQSIVHVVGGPAKHRRGEEDFRLKRKEGEDWMSGVAEGCIASSGDFKAQGKVIASGV